MKNRYFFFIGRKRKYFRTIENAWINYCIDRNIDISQFYSDEEIISEKTETRDDDLER